MRPVLDWTDRGRELGASLNACHAVVVAGGDPVATAEVALGIARQQAAHRRVAVADLFGDAPPLQALVVTDDPHGIVDSFVFGVSLNKIAHAVANSGELFVMPSGSSPIDHEELLPNPRWRRLSGGFREVGALLLLVVPSDAARLRDLVDTTDGIVIVGDVAPPDVPVAQALAWLKPRRPSSASPREAPLAVITATHGRPSGDRRRFVAAGGGVALAVLIAAAMFWFAQRPFAGERPPRAVSAPTPKAPVAAHILRPDSTAPPGVASVSPAPPSIDSFPILTPENPADSARASAWAVRLEQTNTKSGAILDLRIRFETVPAGTYGFDLRTRFFLLVAGGYPTRAGAESLLVQLRQRRIMAPGDGSVIALPLAFLVQPDVPLADVPARLARFAARGQPTYALRQSSGAANLYFGAFASPQEAALAVPTVRESGLPPTLVYRMGRVF